MAAPDIPSELTEVASHFQQNARTPFSRRAATAIVVLSDGTLVPGVRVESASFPLTIPAALNAITTAVASGRKDIVGLYHQGAVPPSTTVLAAGFGLSPAAQGGVWSSPSGMPAPGNVIDPYIRAPEEGTAAAVEAAREVAERAHIPESNFPVGAVLQTESGRWLPGVNVEHPDWASILCAERNALGTAVTFGERSRSMMALCCPKAPGASPCGGCRQLLAELAPGIVVWMDQGASSPLGMTPAELIPLAFSGDSLGS
ncbi:MAG: cytidine deaminase [Rhodothermales bacterium]|nr:cytidine deaminase [Rhodothermales bacterium]